MCQTTIAIPRRGRVPKDDRRLLDKRDDLICALWKGGWNKEDIVGIFGYSIGPRQIDRVLAGRRSDPRSAGDGG
jgi:hypothetical protein